nr:probable RNA-binding protein 19 [Onthophagus taurus]
MSRIIVKNLPKKITEEKIRKIFGERGLLTDVQLKYTSEGTFRRFAFLGYQTEKEAQEAIKHFNNTCIQTNTIVVEACAALGDVAKPKSWSKYSADSSAYKKLHPETIQDELKKKKEDNKKSEKKLNKDDKKAEILKKYKDDPQFEEYLQVHAPHEIELLNNLRTKKDSDDESDDSSDSGVSEPTNDINENEEKVDTSKIKQEKKQKQKKDLKLFNLKLKDLPYKCKKKDIKEFFKPNIPFSIRIPRNIKGIAFVGFKNERQMKKGLMKDRSILSGKSISVTKHIDPTNKGDDAQDPKKVKWKSQEEKLKNEEDIGESGRIFIRNLAYITTEDDVQNLFAAYGPITEVNLPIDSTSRKMKGFGIVTFLLPEHAVKAYSELDGSILHGRMLHLLPGKAKDVQENEEEGNINYKKQKEKKQKAQAGSSHNWNSLFMGHDAVAEAMAGSYGTSKKAVLDPHGQSNAAVRLALGETQIVTETRKYLEAEGVILDAFSGGSIKRSKTIILVKNLPANTEIVELRRVFEKYGIVGRVVLPPKGITAIVEFIEPTEARKAFSSLAYSQFKSVPLLLEWAPENSLQAKSLSKNNKNQSITNVNNENSNVQSETENVSESKQEENEVEEEEIIEPEPDTTLFVKNLNFKTTDEDLKRHFETCGKLYSAMVTMKKDMNNPGNKLSMGYGFVRYFLKSSTNKALKELQGSSLDGKTLELKRSERTLANDVITTRKVTKKGKPTGSKLLVRNVPFQAKKEELFELFKTFGEIKALRLPKKMTVGETTHRGFAFVDYFTSSDAKKAFEALSQSTHLYGRRLVLEWATTEEGIDDLRKRTASHFHNEEAPKSKKSVFNID